MSDNAVISKARSTKSTMSARRPLDPATIFAEIKAQPPLMRPQATQAYLGRSVDWSVIFANASEQPSGRAHLIFRFNQHDMGMITGAASLAQYPQLRSLRSGERIQVRGRIRKIDTLSIELEIRDLGLPKRQKQSRIALSPSV